MHKRKSRRMRIALIIVSVVLVALIGALIYFAFTLINEASDVAYQTASRSDAQTESPAALASDAQDASGQDHGDVPALASLLGKTTDDAVAEVGRGATITSEKDITEETGEGDDKKTEVVGTSVTVALADETTDNSGNNPHAVSRLRQGWSHHARGVFHLGVLVELRRYELCRYRAGGSYHRESPYGCRLAHRRRLDRDACCGGVSHLRRRRHDHRAGGIYLLGHFDGHGWFRA